ncbi:COPII coat assembly protein SEC16 [Candida viswanathii]|uniref:Protein transport protein sec16 n=1 Tax=Candida viswanathii TaxID=5486 RepID=A0A367YHI6_9ASCO|nr:COPII coat assembly protein SEC16 [Candida viswanathii]
MSEPNQDNDLNSQPPPQAIDDLFNDNSNNDDDFFNNMHDQQQPQEQEQPASVTKHASHEQPQVDESIPQSQSIDDLFANEQINHKDDFFSNQINTNHPAPPAAQDLPLNQITDFTRVDHIESVGHNLDEPRQPVEQHQSASGDGQFAAQQPELAYHEDHTASREHEELPANEAPIESLTEPIAQSTQNPIEQPREEIQVVAEVEIPEEAELEASKLDDLFTGNEDEDDNFLEGLKEGPGEVVEVIQEYQQEVSHAPEPAAPQQPTATHDDLFGGDDDVDFLQESQPAQEEPKVEEQPHVEAPPVKQPPAEEPQAKEAAVEQQTSKEPKPELFGDDEVDFLSELKHEEQPQQELKQSSLDKLASLDLDDDLLLDEEFLEEPVPQQPTQQYQPQQPRQQRSYVPAGPAKLPSYAPPPSSSTLTQSNEFIKNLEQSKKKHDAYDFPDTLIVNKVRPAPRQASATSSASNRYGPPSGTQSSVPSVSSSTGPLGDIKTASLAPPAAPPTSAPKKSFFVDFPDEDIPKPRRSVRAVPVKSVNQIHSPLVLNQQNQQQQQPPAAPPTAAATGGAKTAKTPPVNPYKPKSGTSPIFQQHVPLVHQSGIAPPSVNVPNAYAPAQHPPAPQAYAFPPPGPQQATQQQVPPPPGPPASNAYAPVPHAGRAQMSPVNAYAPQPTATLQPVPHGGQPPTTTRNRQPSINTNVGKVPSQNSPYVPNAGPYAPLNQHNRSHSRANSLVGGKGKEINPYAPALHTVVSSEHTPQQQQPGAPTGMLPPPARARGFSNARAGGNIYKSAPKVANPEQLNFRQFPIFSSSVGNRCAIVIPSNMYNNQVPSIVVQPISNLLKDKEIYAEFPGPLIKGKSKKKDIEKWLELSSNYLRNSSKFDELLLNDVLLHLIKHDGDVHNKEFLRAACQLLNPNINFEASEVMSSFAGIVGATNAHKLDNSGINTVFSLIQTGNLTKAYEYCISRGDWALALIISGPENFAKVAAEYARNTFPFAKTNNKVLHIMPIILKVLAGNVSSIIEDLNAVPTEGEYANMHWREIIASVAISGTVKASEFLAEFGRFLQNHGNLIGCELAYIMAGYPFNNTNFMVLASGHNSMYTEVYEYATSITKPLYFPHLVAVKLRHASTLADYGLINESQRYIDYINTSIKSLGNKSPYITPNLIHEFQNLIMRLSEVGSGDQGNWFSGKISKVNLDKIWGQIDKFIVGGEDQQLLKANKVDNGAFRNFSPSVSRNASSVNLPTISNRGPLDHVLERKPTTSSTPGGSTMLPPQLAPPQLIAHGSTNSVSKYSPGTKVDRYAPSPQQGNPLAQDYIAGGSAAPGFPHHSPLPPHLPSNAVNDSPNAPRYAQTANNSRVYGYQIGAQTSTSSLASIGNSSYLHSAQHQHQQQTNQYTPGHKKQFSGSSVISGEGLGIDFNQGDGANKGYAPPPNSDAALRSSNTVVGPNGSPVLQKNSISHGAPLPVMNASVIRQGAPPAANKNYAPPAVQQEIAPPVEQETVAPAPPPAPPKAPVPATQPPVPAIAEPPATQQEEQIPAPPPPSSEPVIDHGEEEKHVHEPSSAPQGSIIEPLKDIPLQSVSAPPQQPVHPEPEVVTDEPKEEQSKEEETVVPSPPPPPAAPPAAPPRRASKPRANPYAPGGSSSAGGGASAPKLKPKRSKYGPPPGIKSEPPVDLSPDPSQLAGGNVDSISMFSYGGYSEPAPFANPHQPQPPAAKEEKPEVLQQPQAVPNIDDSFDDNYSAYGGVKSTPANSTPLILNQGGQNLSLLSTPKNSLQMQQNHAFEGFPIPGSPDDTTRPNSIMGHPRGGAGGFFSSRLSESQSVLYQQYTVADDTVGDYIPIVEEEDEEDEDEDVVAKKKKQQEEERKKQEEEERKKQEEQKKKSASSSSGGGTGGSGRLFSLFGNGNKKQQAEGEKQVYKAHLGQKNTFVYDEKLKRWIDKSKPLEEQIAASAPPPPPPKKKLPTPSSTPGGGPPPLPSSSPTGGAPTPPVAGGPPKSGNNINTLKPKKSLANAGLDDLLSLTENSTPSASRASGTPGGGAGNRRNKRRGYVNVMEK